MTGGRLDPFVGLSIDGSKPVNLSIGGSSMDEKKGFWINSGVLDVR